jgi:hypothetical protein
MNEPQSRKLYCTKLFVSGVRVMEHDQEPAKKPEENPSL